MKRSEELRCIFCLADPSSGDGRKTPLPDVILCVKLPSKDFGLGVGVSELVVARSGVDESTGGYQYTVIFLEETDVVPKMLVGFPTSWDVIRKNHCPNLGRDIVLLHQGTHPFRRGATLHLLILAPPASQKPCSPLRL